MRCGVGQLECDYEEDVRQFAWVHIEDSVWCVSSVPLPSPHPHPHLRYPNEHPYNPTCTRTPLVPLSAASPQSREELKRAIDTSFGFSSEGSCSTRLHGPMGKWDVSRVTNMSEIFYNMHKFNDDISNWDVSRVTDMQLMFANVHSFNQDLSDWDVSRVTDMQEMFAGAGSFNQDLSKWDVSYVMNIRGMFAHAQSFNQDLSKWDVSRVIDMGGMFGLSLIHI